MPTQYKTPGVYINEINAFGNSIVEVPTAVPAFVGYTEKAKAGSTDLTNTPTRIESMVEYTALFGSGPPLSVTWGDKTKTTMVAQNQFLMYQSLKLFYANGGGPCYIVSIGDYGTAQKPTQPQFSDFQPGLAQLEIEPEPTIIVVPEAIKLSGVGEWAKIATNVLAQCDKTQSRVAILDVFDGNKPRGVVAKDDPIDNFREYVGDNFLKYGMAYYPFLNTSIVEASELNFTNLDPSMLKDLTKEITSGQQALADAKAGPGGTGGTIPQPIKDLLKAVEGGKVATDKVDGFHQTLMTLSPIYKQAMTQALAAVNLMPPSPALAGIYTQTDNNVGVWKAPANTSVAAVLSPAVTISHDDQEDLNVPLYGKAVNAIRTFMGRGILVWGARTLDGNSQDWRYINVRRTMIMLEQSIKIACEAYVFAPNDASTWTTVSSMIENFLTNQWKAGALAGSSAAEAFQVQVGLGSTMTGNDILDGYMRVTVKVAVVHPAEFIVLTFQQKMQTS